MTRFTKKIGFVVIVIHKGIIVEHYNFLQILELVFYRHSHFFKVKINTNFDKIMKNCKLSILWLNILNVKLYYLLFN